MSRDVFVLCEKYLSGENGQFCYFILGLGEQVYFIFLFNYVVIKVFYMVFLNFMFCMVGEVEVVC